MKYLIVLLILLIISFLLDSSLCDRCCTINLRKLPLYKLNKFGGHSNETIFSRKVVHNLNECKRFARSKKALAFNFGRYTTLNGKEIENDHFKCFFVTSLSLRHGSIIRCSSNKETIVYHRRKDISERYTCQIFECPEINNSSLPIKDKNYRYYSMYPNYIPSGESTVICVPKAGIFVLSSNNLNYSQAETFCQKSNGSLAHIISEERTNGLAKFISHNIPRYVGLSNKDNEQIWKNSFGCEPLSCFQYRAWGIGEPSNSRGCVAIVTSSNGHVVPFWKAIPCYVSLPFICEIFPLYQ